jgi:hypothetical protein
MYSLQLAITLKLNNIEQLFYSVFVDNVYVITPVQFEEYCLALE